MYPLSMSVSKYIAEEVGASPCKAECVVCADQPGKCDSRVAWGVMLFGQCWRKVKQPVVGALVTRPGTSSRYRQKGSESHQGGVVTPSQGHVQSAQRPPEQSTQACATTSASTWR